MIIDFLNSPSIGMWFIRIKGYGLLLQHPKGMFPQLELYENVTKAFVIFGWKLRLMRP